MKRDCWLCQPAGAHIRVQTGRRPGVTFFLRKTDTDVFCTTDIQIKRRIARFTDAQATFDTLTLICCPADATCLTRVSFGDSDDLNTSSLRLVFEDTCETVKRPPMQVEVPMAFPVLRLPAFVFTDTFQLTYVYSTHVLVDTSFDDVFCEGMKKVSPAF